MQTNIGNPLIAHVAETQSREFGPPVRHTVKVNAWNARPDLGIVLQIDQPTRASQAFIWVPSPPVRLQVPEGALQYSCESGRHSNTYPSPGLARGLPALKWVVSSETEMKDAVSFIKACCDS